jgi:hypothetical protein
MYKEVAVDPACIADDSCFFALREQFGFEKGRYLIADTRRWLQDAMAAVKEAQKRNELKPVKAQTIKAWLNRASKKVEVKDRQILLPSNRQVSSEIATWNDWWSGQQAIRSFDVSVAPSSYPPQFYEFTELSTLDSWKVSPSYSVDRTATAIVAAIEPLLKISKQILLVDNYFNLGSNAVLAELIRAAVKAGCTQLTIVTGCDCASPDMVWAHEYQSLASDDFQCKWLKVPDRFFHDRYLITDTGAITAGHGFSVATQQGTAADKVNLSYCSFDEANTVKQQVQDLEAEGRASVIWSN